MNIETIQILNYSSNKQKTSKLLDALILVWEQSVRATHQFLSEEKIVNLKPYCAEGLQVVHLLVAFDHKQPVAFLGMLGEKIEMLFVAPSHFRKGIGRTLLQYAIDHYQVCYVDVNEQNPDALTFYLQMGFSIYERTDTDNQGNAFPLLKMKL